MAKQPGKVGGRPGAEFPLHFSPGNFCWPTGKEGDSKVLGHFDVFSNTGLWKQETNMAVTSMMTCKIGLIWRHMKTLCRRNGKQQIVSMRWSIAVIFRLNCVFPLNHSHHQQSVPRWIYYSTLIVFLMARFSANQFVWLAPACIFGKT